MENAKLFCHIVKGYDRSYYVVHFSNEESLSKIIELSSVTITLELSKSSYASLKQQRISSAEKIEQSMSKRFANVGRFAFKYRWQSALHVVTFLFLLDPKADMEATETLVGCAENLMGAVRQAVRETEAASVKMRSAANSWRKR